MHLDGRPVATLEKLVPSGASADDDAHPPLLMAIAAMLGVVVVMARVTVHAGSPLDNGDTWFHLRIGHLFWGPWSIGHPGPTSSFATSPWVPTQWSTEMAAAKVEDWFGLPGVAVLFGALFLTLIVALYLLCRGYCAPLPAAVCTGLAVIACGPALSARPQVVSLIGLALVTGLWLRASRTLRPPWLLVPVTWLWATAHGMWSVGVVVGVVAVVGIALDHRPPRRVLGQLAAVPVLSVLAACLTPIGPRLLLSQLAVGARSPLISEWQATSFRTIPAFILAVMVGVAVLWMARRPQVHWTPLLLLVVAAGWGMLVTRMVGCSAVVVAPLLATALQGMLGDRSPRLRMTRSELTALLASAATCLGALCLVAPHTAQQPGGVPRAFTPELSSLPDGAPVAVEDYTGGWIEWRFPGLDPMIDGMLDAYPVSYIRDFGKFRSLEPGWQDFLDRSGARVAVLPKRTPLSAAMQDQLGWRVVDRDAGYLYVVAPDAS